MEMAAAAAAAVQLLDQVGPVEDLRETAEVEVQVLLDKDTLVVIQLLDPIWVLAAAVEKEELEAMVPAVTQVVSQAEQADQVIQLPFLVHQFVMPAVAAAVLQTAAEVPLDEVGELEDRPVVMLQTVQAAAAVATAVLQQATAEME